MKSALMNCLLSMATLMLLSACSEPRGIADLQKFIQQPSATNALSSFDIAPLPATMPLQTFSYAAEGIANPFDEANIIERIAVPEMIFTALPDDGRPRQALEAYELKALIMSGTLSQNGKKWALITAPDQRVYRVTIGDYAGKHIGKIISITDTEVVLEETVRAAETGGWVKRTSRIEIAG